MKKLLIYISLILIVLIFATEFYTRFMTNYCEPWFDKETKIIKRKKNTHGIYKTQFTNTGYFRINNEGWNSHRDYFNRQAPDFNNPAEKSINGKRKTRIAIVGHSNIEGLRIPIENTLSKIFEDELLKKGINAEVYTFGFGGMHLAQALHVSRYAVEKFQPDVLIIGTFLDDFLFETTDKKNFLALSYNGNNPIKEILPTKFHEENDSPLSALYFSKSIKYADTKFNIGITIKSLFTKDSAKSGIAQCNIALMQDSVYEQRILSGIEYILNEFKKVASCSQSHPQIYFIDFPLAVPSFNYSNDYVPGFMSSHNKKICSLIKKYGFPVIDIKNAIMNDANKNHQKYDFPNDSHYNHTAHKVIGQYLAKYFTDIDRLKNSVIE